MITLMAATVMGTAKLTVTTTDTAMSTHTTTVRPQL
jgi:hypothetical protein